jgi:hypothetical protein
MTTSDVFTIVAILLAVLTVIAAKDRKLIFLKFSKFEMYSLVAVFVYVHFLLAFGWFVELIPPLSFFVIAGFPDVCVWAYIITISTLIRIAWKIFKGYFPEKNLEEVLKYYQSLLGRNTEFLAEIIEKYHIEGVVQYLRAMRETPASQDLWDFQAEESDAVINTKYKKFGRAVFYRIILNDIFIDEIAGKNPYLFSVMIREISSTSTRINIAFSYDFANHYLKVLFDEKNGRFFREIRGCQQEQLEDKFPMYRIIKDELPILYALFDDVNVALVNQVWRGVGDPALLEMENEAEQPHSLLRKPIKDENTLWSYRMTNAIKYFDIMLQRAIAQDIKDHMWMYYYEHFCESILENMGEDQDCNGRSGNFSLFNMQEWIKLCRLSSHCCLVSMVYDCMGRCICRLVTTEKLEAKVKNDFISGIWNNLLDLWSEHSSDIKEIKNANVRCILESGVEMFRLPSRLLDPLKEDGIPYLRALEYLWTRRDRPPLDRTAKGERADLFKKEVIDELLPWLKDTDDC